MHVLSSKNGGGLVVQLNRPERKNAHTSTMYLAFADLFASARTDPAVRVIVLTGHAGIFTTGNDVNEFLTRPAYDDGDGQQWNFSMRSAQCRSPSSPS